MDETSYNQGMRQAYRNILGEAIKHLSYLEEKHPNYYIWIMEREDAIAQLRELCESFGDNDWDESLHLADIIEKHLARHLYNSDSGNGNE